MLRNNIGEEGAKAILEVAEGKPQLTTLCGIKPEETERDFSRKKLKAEDAMLLAFDLRKNSTLVEVNLQDKAFSHLTSLLRGSEVELIKEQLRKAAGNRVALLF